MKFNDVLRQRRSMRDFSSNPVPEEILDKILDAALSSPSSSNTQPYRIAVAKGAVRDEIRKNLTKKFIKANRLNRMTLPKKVVHGVVGGLFGGVLPDGDFKVNVNYPTELKKRAVECGVGLYKILDIKRSDLRARDRQMQRNFEFFDAPVAIFLFVHGEREMFSALDAGMFLQSLMLAATAEGLGTCAQGALATWASPVRKQFNIDKDYKLICGLSLGYPTEHVVNNYQPKKRTIHELCFKEKS